MHESILLHPSLQNHTTVEERLIHRIPETMLITNPIINGTTKITPIAIRENLIKFLAFFISYHSEVSFYILRNLPQQTSDRNQLGVRFSVVFQYGFLWVSTAGASQLIGGVWPDIDVADHSTYQCDKL